jgi:hypothetical protein
MADNLKPCEKCGMGIKSPTAKHGWVSVRNGPKEDGTFPFVDCADATAEDVAEYAAAKAELQRRNEAARAAQQDAE